MDVNGTKFHLLYGQSDWTDCRVLDREASIASLNQSADPSPFEWLGDELQGALALRAQPQIFRRAKPTGRGSSDAEAIELPRGTARDLRGYWYWIDTGRNRILRQRQQDSAAEILYPQTPVLMPAPTPEPGAFTAQRIEIERATVRGLWGLAITTRDYLVAGVIAPETGLLVFDILRGGAPQFISFRQQAFIPHDLAATSDGGLLILDDSGTHFWRLGPDLRPPASESVSGSIFAPVDGEAPDNEVPLAYSAALPDGLQGIAISAGPDNSALILTANDADGDIYAYYHRPALQNGYWVRYSLEDVTRDPNTQDEGGQKIDIPGVDIAFMQLTRDCLESSNPPWLRREVSPAGIPLVLVAHAAGDQVVAFELMPHDTPDESITASDPPIEGRLHVLPDFLPMRRWGERGIAIAGCRVWYDSGDGLSSPVMFVPLASFGEPQYPVRATLLTPDEFPGELDIQPFDGEQAGCVWHRLLIDARIPTGTRVSVRARAADAPDLLPQAIWREQPSFRRRPTGSELPYYTIPALRPVDPAANPDSVPCDPADTERSGTWEILLQEIKGRYIQLELTLEGGGRATPRIYALRLWYPRFSYLQYLPAIYREDPFHASFLERWLANFEGALTGLEDMIDQLAILLDPRSSPAEALPWLAGWLGLILDPLWQVEQRRFFIRHAMAFYRIRGTLQGIDVALRLYMGQCLDERSLFDMATVGSGRIRIEEATYMVGVEQDVLPGDTQALRAARSDVAHTFRIRIPRDTSEADAAMIERIVNLAKPAHTDFSLVRYDEGFNLGNVYAGIDSILRTGPETEDLTLGRTRLDYARLSQYSRQRGGHMISGTDYLLNTPDVPSE